MTVMPSATSVSLLPDTFCLRGLPMLQGDVRLDPRLSVVTECLHPGTAGDALITKPEWSRVFRDLPSGMTLPWPCAETGL